MKHTHKLTLLLLLLILSLTSCAQKPKKMNEIDKKITSFYKNYQFLNESRPGYYIQINSQNCHYELRVNDGPSAKFYSPYPGYSQRVPINYDIFKSGEQKLSLTVVPYTGDTISARANVVLRLMRYPDMTDRENAYGGSTILWSWKMPHIGEQKLPLFQFDTVFKADVPYKIDVLDKYAADLSKLDKAVLLQEVLTEITQKRREIISKIEDRSLLRCKYMRLLVQLYENEVFIDEAVDSEIEGISVDLIPQPLENYELRLYYNNRLATLLRKDNKGPAIWFKNKEGTKINSRHYYLFKDKETGTWHAW